MLMLTTTTLAAESLNYPQTRREDVVDTLHGVKIADPYRWLEDDNSEETKGWVQAQNKVTFGYLEKLPKREEIKERLKELWNYERVGMPFERGGRWFYSHNSGLQNQAVLMTTESLEGEGKVLLDPNAMSKDGTTSLSDYEPSEDGKLIAYGVSEAGSDWTTIRVRDIATGLDLEDVVKWVKFSGVSWLKDGSGFFYSRYDEPKPGAALTAKNEFHKLYFHKLGTTQSDDTLIYDRKDEPKWGFGGHVTEDGDYLIIQVWLGTEPKNRVFYKKNAGDGPVVELLNERRALLIHRQRRPSVLLPHGSERVVLPGHRHRHDKAAARQLAHCGAGSAEGSTGRREHGGRANVLRVSAGCEDGSEVLRLCGEADS
jgi:prolyl oligopeptidase